MTKGQPQQLQVQLPPRGPAAAAAAAPSAGSAAEATSTDEAARAGKQRVRAAAAGTGCQVKTQPFHTTSQLAVIALAPRFLGDDDLVYYFTPGMKVTIPAGANTSDSVQQAKVVQQIIAGAPTTGMCPAAVVVQQGDPLTFCMLHDCADEALGMSADARAMREKAMTCVMKDCWAAMAAWTLHQHADRYDNGQCVPLHSKGEKGVKAYMRK